MSTLCNYDTPVLDCSILVLKKKCAGFIINDLTDTVVKSRRGLQPPILLKVDPRKVVLAPTNYLLLLKPLLFSLSPAGLQAEGSLHSNSRAPPTHCQ